MAGLEGSTARVDGALTRLSTGMSPFSFRLGRCHHCPAACSALPAATASPVRVNVSSQVP